MSSQLKKKIWTKPVVRRIEVTGELLELLARNAPAEAPMRETCKKRARR